MGHVIRGDREPTRSPHTVKLDTCGSRGPTTLPRHDDGALAARIVRRRWAATAAPQTCPQSSATNLGHHSVWFAERAPKVPNLFCAVARAPFLAKAERVEWQERPPYGIYGK